MFEIELKFYNKEWKNYFRKQFKKNKAIKLFNALLIEFPSSEWRLIYIPLKKE